MRLMVKMILCIAASFALLVMVHGQASVGLMPVSHYQFFDANGIPLSGGCLFTYISGTVTNQATYTDFTGVVQNSNPVILDAGGYANIWLDQTKTYKLKLVSSGGANCASGTSQWTVDNVPGNASSSHLFAGDGTCSSTGIGFVSEITTGFIRSSSGTIDVCSAGVDVLRITAAALRPFTAGSMTLGTAAFPYSSEYIGAVGTNNAQITGTFTGARVFTLPDVASDTFVMLNAAQTVTNKSFKADTNKIVDPTDITKILNFSESGATTGTTLTLAGIQTANRTITFPDRTDTVVTLGGTQTLAGPKTLTSPVINQPTIGTGITASSGLQFARFGPTCSTPTTQFSTCTTTYTWPVAFADTNYTAVCVGVGEVTGPSGLMIEVLTTTTFNARLFNLSSGVASSYTAVHCVGAHD